MDADEHRGRDRGKIVARLEWEAERTEFLLIIEDGKKKKPPRPPTREQLDKVDLRYAPELDAGSMRILRAFDDISTMRPSSFSGIPRIPWSAVLAWGVEHGLSYQQRNRLWRIIRLVDAKVRRRINEGRP